MRYEEQQGRTRAAFEKLVNLASKSLVDKIVADLRSQLSPVALAWYDGLSDIVKKERFRARILAAEIGTEASIRVMDEIVARYQAEFDREGVPAMKDEETEWR